MKHHRYLIACVLPFLFPYSVLGDKTTQQHLAEGNQYLTSGEFNNALMSFDAAIRMEPDNYLTYFKRATAYLSLGRNNQAAEDFTKILDLKPDFDNALIQRARIYIKMGEFESIILDIEKYIKKHPNDKEADAMLKIAKKVESQEHRMNIAYGSGDWETCISLATEVSRASPLYSRARLVRAQCHVARGEIDEAAGDFARVAQLNPSDPDILILLAKINFYSLNEAQGALTHVKQCLHYDPEQKQCKSLFRRIKKLNKDLASIETDIELKKYATASNRLIGTSNRQGLLSEIESEYEQLEKQLNNTPPKKLHGTCYQLACKLYGQQKDDTNIEKWCSLVLDSQVDVDALMYRGQVLLNKKDLEGAIRDLEKANEMAGGQNHKVRQLLQQAQQMLKQSKKRDYYKILEVSPNADSREIKKAYRKKAHEWHPDKYSGELEKEQVERKMAEINQAYEVLSDPDKRQQFDNGFDPYDPEQGNGQGGGTTGGFPFHQYQGGFNFPGGGFPFGSSNGFPGGSGGSQFKFQF